MVDQDISQEYLRKLTQLQLVLLIKRLKSNKYPCPLCLRQGREMIGEIEVSWDSECDDMGYVVSRWPVFTGDCKDEVFRAEDGHIVNRFNRRPLNHADSMNKDLEDDTYSDHVARLMGQSYERKELAKIFGIEVQR